MSRLERLKKAVRGMVSRGSGLPVIPANQIHVWSATLTPETRVEERFESLLSADELVRAAKYRFPADCRRSIFSRGVLRTLLGRYLDVAPETLSFVRGAHGKPELTDQALQFNVSHAADQALFAFSSDSPLGVDLEPLRPLPDLNEVAAGVLSAAELCELAAMPPQEQTEAFLKCWTSKEALVKGVGFGLSYPANHLTLSLMAPGRLLHAASAPEEFAGWSLYTLEMEPDAVAMLAARGHDCDIVMRRFAD